MKQRATYWFPILLVTLLAALTYWLDRSVQATLPKRDGSQRHDPDYIVDSLSALRLGPDGLPQSKLTAKQMVHYPDDDSTHLEAPHFFSLGQDKPVTHIEAKRGLVSKEGAHVYFYEDVKAVREPYTDHSRLVMTTSFLHLVPDDETADTDKPVDIRDAKTHLTATGLQLDNKHRTIKLLSSVRGRYEKSPASR